MEHYTAQDYSYISNRIAFFVQSTSGLFGLLPIVFQLSAPDSGLLKLEFVNVQKNTKLQYHCPTISQIVIFQELAQLSSSEGEAITIEKQKTSRLGGLGKN
jgi:hypothetical protein